MSIYKLVLRQRLHEQLVVNVLHFKGFPGLTTAESLALDFDAFLTAQWAPIVSNELKFESIEVQEMTADLPAAHVKVPTTATGGVAGTAAPGSLAATMALRSSFAARTKNGRFFLAGIAQVNLAAGKWTGAMQALLAAFAAAILAEFRERDLIAGEWTLGIWSSKKGVGAPPKYDASRFTGVKSIRVASVPGVLHRRKIGVGD